MLYGRAKLGVGDGDVLAAVQAFDRVLRDASAKANTSGSAPAGGVSAFAVSPPEWTVPGVDVARPFPCLSRECAHGVGITKIYQPRRFAPGESERSRKEAAKTL